MADRTFPPLDRLNVLLHRRRLRPAFLIVSSTEFVDVVPLATHGFRLPAHVETHETVVHCSTVFAAWTYLDRKDCVPFDADALEEAASALCKEFLSNPLQAGACRTASGGTQNAVFNSAMNAEARYERSPSVSEPEHWRALGTGALLLIVGASRRSVMGACLAASSVPLLYRGITGRWPKVLNGHLQRDNTRAALGGERGRSATNTTRASRW